MIIDPKLTSRKPVQLFGLVLLLFFPVLGCATKKSPVTGKVTYQDEPVASATVSFYAAGNVVVNAKTNSDGTYTATDVPVGKVKVSVASMGANPKGGAGMERGRGMMDPSKMGKKDESKAPEPAKEGDDSEPVITKIPAKYGDPENSGLELEVKADQQNTFNIPLK